MLFYLKGTVVILRKIQWSIILFKETVFIFKSFIDSIISSVCSYQAWPIDGGVLEETPSDNRDLLVSG